MMERSSGGRGCNRVDGVHEQVQRDLSEFRARATNGRDGADVELDVGSVTYFAADELQRDPQHLRELDQFGVVSGGRQFDAPCDVENPIGALKGSIECLFDLQDLRSQ